MELYVIYYGQTLQIKEDQDLVHLQEELVIVGVKTLQINSIIKIV